MLKSFDSLKLKDTHYLVKWDKDDLPEIRKWQERIRAGLDSSVEFTDLLEDSLNDHHNLKIDPLDIAVDRKYVLTWKGIAKMLRNVTGQDTEYFAAGGVAVGEGSSTPTPFDYKLTQEFSYIDFATNGFFDAAGVCIRYCGTFGEDLQDADLTESLVRNQTAVTNSTVLCRNTFANNPINHNEGNSGFSAAGIIEFIPVVD